MQLTKLTLSGKDSSDFLQRQLTADVAAIPENTPTITAWCNIQGRVTSLMWLEKANDSITLFIPSETYSQVMPRLKMFVMRDDVSFSEPESCYCRMVGGMFSLTTESAAGWEQAFVELGIPVLAAEDSAKYLPQMLNLDQLNGLSFSKGCYPGQEIVARTHFRGKLKQRMVRLNSAMAHGHDVMDSNGTKAGSVLFSSATECLAMVKIEATERGLAADDGSAVAQLPLPYLPS